MLLYFSFNSREENEQSELINKVEDNYKSSSGMMSSDRTDSSQPDPEYRQVIATCRIQPHEKTIGCFYCPYQTNRRNHLNEHNRSVHLRMKTVCDLCGKGRAS